MKFKLFVFLLFAIAHQSIGQKTISQMTDIEKADLFAEKTERRVNDLEVYIKTIGDKSRDREIRVEAVNAACKYFISEESIFEVTSLNRPKRRHKVRKYLNNLMVLRYDKVEISWYKTHWATKLRKGKDGSYYGVVRIFQKFVGSNSEGDVMYQDITEKDIEVKVDILEMDLGNSTKEVIVVYLGDVSVVATRA